MNQINPSRALYIKLGREGNWEEDCIKNRTLRLGYRETPDELCSSNKWKEVKRIWLKERSGNKGVATRDVNQIRLFYESDNNVLWITFFQGKLYWCFSDKKISVMDDGSKIRKTKAEEAGWSSSDLNGDGLYLSNLSGKITKTQGFRGTICEIKGDAFRYIVDRINGVESGIIKNVHRSKGLYQKSVEKMIENLNWKDFELFVDLIFTRAGWQRISERGGKQKTVDLEFIFPIASKSSPLETYVIQVKSSANRNDFLEFQTGCSEREATRFYFVVHKAQNGLEKCTPPENFELLLKGDLAQLAIKFGLDDWLVQKV